MFDILPALLWIVAAVISLNICSITAIRGNIFSKTKSDVYPVRWSIVGLHFTSLIIGALPYPIYTMFKPSFSLKFQHFYEQVGWPSAALMVMLIATELVFMYLQARNGMKSEMERKLSQAIKDCQKDIHRSENAAVWKNVQRSEDAPSIMPVGYVEQSPERDVLA